MFTVDGLTWDVPCVITRGSTVKSSNNSGMMLDKNYFNDVLATYLTYTVKIAIPFGKEDIYYLLYEILNNPVDGHAFTFPYNDEEVNVTARVDKISDYYAPYVNGKKYWRGIGFTCTSNNPLKSTTLGEVIERGRTPFPPISSPEIGDTYQYTANGWVKLLTEQEG